MITIEEFRTVEEWRGPLSFFLKSDAGLAALRVLRDYGRGYDVKIDVEPMASVRMLSKCGGINTAVDLLEAMAEPPRPPAQDLGEPGFGVEPEADDQTPSQYNPDKDAALQERRARAMADADKIAAGES